MRTKSCLKSYNYRMQTYSHRDNPSAVLSWVQRLNNSSKRWSWRWANRSMKSLHSVSSRNSHWKTNRKSPETNNFNCIAYILKSCSIGKSNTKINATFHSNLINITSAQHLPLTLKPYIFIVTILCHKASACIMEISRSRHSRHLIS